MRALREKIVSFFRKRKDPQPLVTHHQDVEILRQMKKRKIPDLTQIRHAGRVLSRSEKRLMKLGVAGLLIGAVWLGTAWVLTHRVSVPDVGGRYVEGLVGSPQFVNPLFSSLNDVDSDLARLIYSGLMRYDENGTFTPDLAERYTMSEDKKTYTFVLRKNVTWHDNEQEIFSAKDVKFTFDLIQDRSVGSPLFVSFEGVEVKVVDDFTVEFVLKEAFPLFLSSLTVGILPEHIWSNIPGNQLRLAKYNVQPIGTGPYMFRRLSKNESGYIDKYELVRFDRFYRSPAYIEEFIFAFFPAYESDAGSVEALRAQKIQGLGFVPSNLQDKVSKKSIVLHNLSLPQYTALFFNLERTGWRENKNVREALALAIDRNRIVTESLKNEGQIAEGPILPHFYTLDHVTSTPYDVNAGNATLDKLFSRVDASTYKETRREQLLKAYREQQESVSSTVPLDETLLLAQVQAALEKEFSSPQTFYRLDKDKNILQIDLVTADTEEYRHTAELVAGFWQDLGIRVNVALVNPKNIEKDVLRERKYDVLLYGIILGDNPDPYPFWHSSQIKYPGVNLSQYTNRTVDTLLEKIRTLNDPEQMKQTYTQFHSLLYNDRPAIFLYSPFYRYMLSTDVKGVALQKIYHPSDRFSSVTSWYMETKGQWK